MHRVSYNLRQEAMERHLHEDQQIMDKVLTKVLESEQVQDTMDWHLEVKRLIFDELDGVYANAQFPFVVEAEIIDNKLIMSVSHADLNESKDFEVILKELNGD